MLADGLVHATSGRWNTEVDEICVAGISRALLVDCDTKQKRDDDMTSCASRQASSSCQTTNTFHYLTDIGRISTEVNMDGRDGWTRILSCSNEERQTMKVAQAVSCTSNNKHTIRDGTGFELSLIHI